MIDTAVHLWDVNYHRMHGDWLDPYPELKRSWLPADLEPELRAAGVEKAVIIEAARDRLDINLFWLELAHTHPFLGAVIAGCKLEQPDLPRWLDTFSRFSEFAGIRTMPAGPPETWHENPQTAAGLRELARRDLILELLVGWQAFAAASRLARAYPSLRIVLDHCGKPPLISEPDEMASWSAALDMPAACPNITMKYSSLLAFAGENRDRGRLGVVAQRLLSAFGVDRLMWGSDWPLVTHFTTYAANLSLMQELTGPLSPNERSALFRDTALRVYEPKQALPRCRH